MRQENVVGKNNSQQEKYSENDIQAGLEKCKGLRAGKGQGSTPGNDNGNNVVGNLGPCPPPCNIQKLCVPVEEVKMQRNFHIEDPKRVHSRLRWPHLVHKMANGTEVLLPPQLADHCVRHQRWVVQSWTRKYVVMPIHTNVFLDTLVQPFPLPPAMKLDFKRWCYAPTGLAIHLNKEKKEIGMLLEDCRVLLFPFLANPCCQAKLVAEIRAEYKPSENLQNHIWA
jgi:hypothetical protein